MAGYIRPSRSWGGVMTGAPNDPGTQFAPQMRQLAQVMTRGAGVPGGSSIPPVPPPSGWSQPPATTTPAQTPDSGGWNFDFSFLPQMGGIVGGEAHSPDKMQQFASLMAESARGPRGEDTWGDIATDVAGTLVGAWGMGKQRRLKEAEDKAAADEAALDDVLKRQVAGEVLDTDPERAGVLLDNPELMAIHQERQQTAEPSDAFLDEVVPGGGEMWKLPDGTTYLADTYRRRRMLADMGGTPVGEQQVDVIDGMPYDRATQQPLYPDLAARRQAEAAQGGGGGARTARDRAGALRYVDGPQAGQLVFPGVEAPAGGAPGAAPSSRLTEGQQKFTIFGQRGLEALETLYAPGEDGRTLFEHLSNPGDRAAEALLGWSGSEKFFQSNDYKAAEQAFEVALMAMLRAESGAAISNEELQNAKKAYLPHPSDPPSVIEQKRRGLEGFTESVLGVLPPDWQARIRQRQTASGGPAYQPGQTAANPVTGAVEAVSDVLSGLGGGQAAPAAPEQTDLSGYHPSIQAAMAAPTYNVTVQAPDGSTAEVDTLTAAGLVSTGNYTILPEEQSAPPAAAPPPAAPSTAPSTTPSGVDPALMGQIEQQFAPGVSGMGATERAVPTRPVFREAPPPQPPVRMRNRAGREIEVPAHTEQTWIDAGYTRVS